MLRDSLTQAQKDAMKARDKDRLAAIRLILAKIKDRDIELRTAPAAGGRSPGRPRRRCAALAAAAGCVSGLQ